MSYVVEVNNTHILLIKNFNTFLGIILMLITEVELGIVMASFPWSSGLREV